MSPAATAFLQGGLFGLAGTLPSTYTQALMGGQVGRTRPTNLASPPQFLSYPLLQGVGGVVVALLNIFTLFSSDSNTSAFIFFIIAVAVILACISAFGVLLRLPIVRYYIALTTQPSSGNKGSDATRKSLARQRSYLRSDYSLWETFHCIKGMALLVGLNFLVTLAVFPGITANIVSV
jgi:hypothetical protein